MAAESNPKSATIPTMAGLIFIFIALPNFSRFASAPRASAFSRSAQTVGIGLLHFFKPRNHGAAGTIDRTIFVDGEYQGTRQHQPEVAFGDDFIAFDGVGAVDGVRTEANIRLAVLELGVYRTARVAVLSFRAAAASDHESGGDQKRCEKRLTQD